jgi:hypothetical protein
MKNKFFFLIISLLITQFLIAQNETKVAVALREFNNDTASYIKQHILARKGSYIGKPLDSLMKDLPMIIDYGNADIPHNRFICPSTSLYFATSKQILGALNRKEFAQFVTITWAVPLDNKELSVLGLPLWGGKWTEAAQSYYKNKIIGNIEIIKYH